MTDRFTSSAADYLAAERTFLAWIRTGLALMGFGFVVARFVLFLKMLQIGQSNLELRPYGLSFWFGTALILRLLLLFPSDATRAPFTPKASQPGIGASVNW